MCSIPLTSAPSLAWTYLAKKDKRAGAHSSKAHDQFTAGPRKGRRKNLKFNHVWNCKFEIGLRILIYES